MLMKVCEQGLICRLGLSNWKNGLAIYGNGEDQRRATVKYGADLSLGYFKPEVPIWQRHGNVKCAEIHIKLKISEVIQLGDTNLEVINLRWHLKS